MSTKREYRGSLLVTILKSNVKGAGFIKLDKNGRLCYFTFRGIDYSVSSRLHVTECGFGRNVNKGRSDITPDAIGLTDRLKKAAA